MKKSLVAVGVIIALGAVWTGASWYTGKQLAQNIDTVTAEMNKRLQEAYPNVGAKLVYRDYKGGIFTSTFSLVLQADGSAPNSPLFTPGTEIVMNETVSHGPLPLAQLKTFNLTPSLAAVYSELVNNATTQSLFNVLQNQPFITAQTRVAFNGDTASLITLRPVDVSNNTEKFQFSGSDIALDIAHDMRSNRIQGVLPKVLVEKANALGQKEQVRLEDFSVNANNHRGKFDLDLGDGIVSIKSLTFTTDTGEPVTLNNLVVKSTLGEDDKNLAGQFTLSLDALSLSNRDLGSARVNMTFSQLDGEATKQFVHTYQQMSSQFLQSGGNMDPFQFQHQVGMTFLQSLPQLLKGNPQFTISPISWKNTKGESTLSLALNLSDPVQNGALDPAPQSDEESLIRRSVKKLDVTLYAPMSMLAEGIIQAGGQPQSDTERQQLAASAQEQVKLLAGIGEMNQMTLTKDDAITSSLHYADNQVDFNGNKMSLADFIAPFISIPTDQGGEEDDAAPATQDVPVTPQKIN